MHHDVECTHLGMVVPLRVIGEARVSQSQKQRTIADVESRPVLPPASLRDPSWSQMCVCLAHRRRRHPRRRIALEASAHGWLLSVLSATVLPLSKSGRTGILEHTKSLTGNCSRSGVIAVLLIRNLFLHFLSRDGSFSAFFNVAGETRPLVNTAQMWNAHQMYRVLRPSGRALRGPY